MAAKEEKNGDFYSVLGLKKECTALELRNAYKKLALRWHPDRLSASGNSKFVEEAKKNFQAIQEAYSVLSDANKRFMYDVGVYDTDDDENGMGEFLGEMAAMMSQTAANENVQEDSLEDIQELFEEMFQRDIDTFSSTFSRDSSASSSCSNNNSINKRNCDHMRSEETNLNEFSIFDKEDPCDVRNFCFGSQAAEETEESRGRSRGGGKGRKRRSGRKQKLSSGHDVSSSRDSRISAG